MGFTGERGRLSKPSGIQEDRALFSRSAFVNLRGSGLRTIIIDPVDQRVEETTEILVKLGHQVVAIVGDGIWAVSFCKKHKPELAVLHHTLPQLSCEKVIKALRRDDSTRYIIVGQDSMAQPWARLFGDPHIVAVRRPFTEHNLGITITLMKNTPALTMPEWGLSRLEQLPRN